MNKVVLREEVDEYIKNLVNDPDSLGGYLMSLAKKGLVSDDILPLYTSLIDNEDWYLQKVSCYVCLFLFKKREFAYTQKCLKILLGISNSAELRIWVASGLGTAFKETNDLSLVNPVLTICTNKSDDLLVRNSCASLIISVIGIDPDIIDFISDVDYVDYEMIEKNIEKVVGVVRLKRVD